MRNCKQCNSSFVISPDNNSSPPYTPANNACGGNVVAYNLMAGYVWFQSSISSSWWLSVGQWKADCITYNSSRLPTTLSTTGINMPSWAFQIPTGTTWYPVEASSTAAPNGFTTTRRLSATNRPSDITDNAAAATGRALLAIFISPVVLGGFVILCITGSIAHCWRQRGRRKLYGPMSAYYRTQRAELYDGPYQANANPGAFGSASPQFPPSTHPSSQAFSPLRASVMPSPQTSPHK